MKEDSDDSLASVDAVKQIGGKVPPLKVYVLIDDCYILMEIDMGSSVLIMAESTYQKLWPTKELRAQISNYKCILGNLCQ